MHNAVKKGINTHCYAQMARKDFKDREYGAKHSAYRDWLVNGLFPRTPCHKKSEIGEHQAEENENKRRYELLEGVAAMIEPGQNGPGIHKKR
jgi:hypothetical protein